MMIDRIRSKFSGWKAQTLSRAGRLTLIKASVTDVSSRATTLKFPLWPGNTFACLKVWEALGSDLRLFSTKRL
ncbi:hypothetical protein L3X38_026891 [Prunus dulcis]|uniref:Uncharacterized protein n=1 Tax=Prunus dulcis TaxID=3755 RepID=A0AAD4VLU5_PRUDU|nr:hypothetical protein L3X38_026891 [Prunus dulcis]